MFDLIDYTGVLIFIIIALGVGIAIQCVHLVSKFTGIAPNRPSKTKNAAFECGFDAFDDARIPFDIRYFLVAILFIIFDLETAYLFPWAVTFRTMSWLGIGTMVFFLSVLTFGFIYEWRIGALEWE
jgi:NADH-quinone oxidoreductase subunit A